MQSIRGGCEVHGWAHSRNGAELRRSFPSPFSSELEHQIAAHGESREGEAGNPVLVDQVLGDCGYIPRASRMIERRRQSVCAAAIALVHAHYIHARSHALRGDTQHVLRLAGTFKAMHDNHSQRIFPIGLPVAMTQHLRAGFDFDQSLFGGRKRNSPGQKETCQGLKMSRHANRDVAQILVLPFA